VRRWPWRESAAAEGDIRQGQGGASLVDATAKAAVEKAQAGVAKAEADLGLADKTYRRLQELLKEALLPNKISITPRGNTWLSQAGLQRSPGDLAAARAGLSQVNVYQADVQRAQAAVEQGPSRPAAYPHNLEECEIIAPTGWRLPP
jgi:HlyD family secretion protein